jgi:hypothetical protein
MFDASPDYDKEVLNILTDITGKLHQVEYMRDHSNESTYDSIDMINLHKEIVYFTQLGQQYSHRQLYPVYNMLRDVDINVSKIIDICKKYDSPLCRTILARYNHHQQPPTTTNKKNLKLIHF